MRTGPLALAVVVVLALAGCVPSDSHPTAAPSSRATPVFASDEEALAAAEAAYAAYEAAVDKSLQLLDESGLASVSSGAALKTAIGSVQDFKDQGRRQIGASKVVYAAPQDLSALTGSSSGSAEIYACLDVSEVQVIDADGRSVSAPDRVTVFPLVVSFAWQAEQKLVVSKEVVWDGKPFCP